MSSTSDVSSMEFVIPTESDDTLSDITWLGSDVNDDDSDITDVSEGIAMVSRVTLRGGDNEGELQGGQTDSGLTRNEKMKILKRLMKEVNLEDTLDKYRGMSDGGGGSWPTQSLPPRSFVSSVMDYSSPLGTSSKDMLFCADRQYMAKLELQLETQYQSLMDKKEEERADLERQRMRRLMVEGIIGPEALQEDGYLKSRTPNSHSQTRRGTIHNHKKGWSPRHDGGSWRSKSAPEPKIRNQTGSTTPASNTRTHTQAASAHVQTNRKGTSPIPQTPRYSESCFNGDTQISRMVREESEEGEERRAHFRKCFVHDEEGCTCDSSRPERRNTSIQRYQDPLIEQLKEPDVTVDQMYDLADTILPVDRPKTYLQEHIKGKKKLSAAQERRRVEMLLSGVPRR